MQKKTKSLLDELNDFAARKDKETILESRASHIIDSAINLLKHIRETFDPEIAYELERRFINSIKSGDNAKFTRGIRKIKENKEISQGLKIINGNVKHDD